MFNEGRRGTCYTPKTHDLGVTFVERTTSKIQFVTRTGNQFQQKELDAIQKEKMVDRRPYTS